MLDVTTPGGHWLVLALMVPVAGLLLAVLFGGRRAERIALAALPLGAIAALAIVMQMLSSGAALVYRLGDWAPPLGIVLRADGLSVAMMVTTVVVLTAIALFARVDFATPQGAREARAPFVFWVMLLGVWAALRWCSWPEPGLNLCRSRRESHPY